MEGFSPIPRWLLPGPEQKASVTLKKIVKEGQLAPALVVESAVPLFPTSGRLPPGPACITDIEVSHRRKANFVAAFPA